MGKLILFSREEECDVEYLLDGKKIIGVSHSNWPFWVEKEGDNSSLFCKKTGERFGTMESKEFNRTLLSWLMIDDPKMVDDWSGSGVAAWEKLKEEGDEKI